MRRRLALLTVIALAGACTASEPPVAEPRRVNLEQRDITLPPPRTATAAFVVRTLKPLAKRRVEKIESTRGVVEVAPLSVKSVKVVSARRTVRLRVAEMNPLELRSLTPAPTRDAEFVWASLILGRAVATFEAQKALKLKGAEEIVIDGTPGFQVGAFADNGVPNIADVLVQNGAERQLGFGPPRVYVVGAKAGTVVEELGRALRKRLPEARLKRLIPKDRTAVQATTPSASRPVGEVSGGLVGSMTFQILPSGFIRPDPAWVASNIVSAEVPILGMVTCHRLMIAPLARALAEIEEAGLASTIDTRDYGGCYVPRFIDRDPNKSLSMHAFGLAVDLNVQENHLGTRGNMDPEVVGIFERSGFVWGGRWSRPDPMHFELGA